VYIKPYLYNHFQQLVDKYRALIIVQNVIAMSVDYQSHLPIISQDGCRVFSLLNYVLFRQLGDVSDRVSGSGANQCPSARLLLKLVKTHTDQESGQR